MGFVVLFPLAPMTLGYFLWKGQNLSLAPVIGWVISSLLFTLGLQNEWIDHLNEQSALGYQVGMISFALPATLYVVTVLIHSTARIRKYGLQSESIYRGD
ncbi:MAG: hypothetical protein ACFFF4_09710 [Candidatus Thorarchaeota archaeon]